MITIGLILLGAFIGALTTYIICSQQYSASIKSACKHVERLSYARGYEDGSLPGQRKALRGASVRTEGTLLVTEVEPTVIKRLALKWAEQGRRCSCHAWLAVLAALNLRMGLLMAVGVGVVLVGLRMFIERDGVGVIDEATSDWLKTKGDHQTDEEDAT